MIINDFAGHTGYTLRPLGSIDMPAFIELGLPTCSFMHGRPEQAPEEMRKNFTSFVREYAFQPESEIFVVRSPGHEVVAQIWMHATHNRFNGLSELWVWDLTVREDHRERGFGRHLLELARTRAEMRDCEELWLLVSSLNDKAVKLYQSVGMRFAGHLMSKPVTAQSEAEAGPAIPVQAAAQRKLTPGDIQQLFRLWEAAGLPCRPKGRDRSDRLSRHLRSNAGGGWGIFQGDTLIAAALYSFDGRKGFIERLATRPENRQAGLARVVVTAALQSLRQLDALVIAALIEEDNLPSRRLFEALGFVNSPSLCYYSIRNSEDS